MSRIQLALDVDDLEASIAFYTRLLGTDAGQAPPGLRQLRRRRSAAQARADRQPRPRRVDQPPRHRGRRHREVDAELTRLSAAGLASTEERDTTCCYALQDKFWVDDTPDGERWEIYTVLADSATFAATDTGTPAGCC